MVQLKLESNPTMRNLLLSMQQGERETAAYAQQRSPWCNLPEVLDPVGSPAPIESRGVASAQ